LRHCGLAPFLGGVGGGVHKGTKVCQAPFAIRRFSGVQTGLNGPSGVEVIEGELFVTNWNGNSVTVYPATANGDVPPLRTIQGGSTLLDTPWGIDGPRAGVFLFAESFESGGTTEWSSASS